MSFNFIKRYFYLLVRSLGSPWSFLKFFSVVAFSPTLVTKEFLLFKYQLDLYSKDFKPKDRLKALTYHYSFLKNNLSNFFLKQISTARTLIWVRHKDEHNLMIWLVIAPTTDLEGELSLYFQVNGTDIYILSFVVVSTDLCKYNLEKPAPAILVCRLQGFKGQAEKVKDSTVSMGNISPGLILMDALEGLALAWGIEHVFGICAEFQIYNKTAKHQADFVAAYDHFWEAIEGKQLDSKYFYLNCPLPVKPIEKIKENHRTRVKARRAYRREVSKEIYRAVRYVSFSRTKSSLVPKDYD